MGKNVENVENDDFDICADDIFFLERGRVIYVDKIGRK